MTVTTNLATSGVGLPIILGTITNDTAAVGVVGEFITSNIPLGSAVALTNNIVSNITSINLTAGDWDIEGSVDFSLVTVTATQIICGASTTSATLPTQAGGSGLGTDAWINVLVTITGITSTSVNNFPSTRVSIATPTTIFLVAQVGFSLGTVSGYGSIRARRAR